MITSDNPSAVPSSSNDSSYFCQSRRIAKNEFCILVYKKILRLEEELEALGGEDGGGETTRSNVIKTPNLTPKKVCHHFRNVSISMDVDFRALHCQCLLDRILKMNYLV